jgi:uncharacterized protein (TIGR00162 family)
LVETKPLPEIQVRLLSSPNPSNPVLVCGLPGSGFVGKLAADYLVTVFKAKKVADFYATSFPPHVNIDEDGLAMRLRGELFHAETGQENDILVFTADAQRTTSAGEYELAEAVLTEAKKLRAKLVFSLGAYVTGSFVKERRVHGTSTSPEVIPRLSKNGVEIMRDGGITGMNGVMVGMASLLGMDGVALLGETSGYLVDPSASQAVLESLSKILGVRIDMTSIEERAKEAQQVLSQVARMEEQEVEEVRGSKEEGKPGYIG